MEYCRSYKYQAGECGAHQSYLRKFEKYMLISTKNTAT